MQPIDKIDDLRREQRFSDALIGHHCACVNLHKTVERGKKCIERAKINLKKQQHG